MFMIERYLTAVYRNHDLGKDAEKLNLKISALLKGKVNYNIFLCYGDTLSNII